MRCTAKTGHDRDIAPVALRARGARLAAVRNAEPHTLRMAQSLHDLAAVSADVALTLVVPAERTGENRAFDSHLNRMLAQAQAQITEQANKRTARRMVRAVQESTGALDRSHLSSGLWVGAYDDEVIVHHLDDAVEPTVTVGRRLDLLPLVRQGRRMDALVLLLTETGCRLLIYRSDRPTLQDRIRPLKVRGLPAKFHGEGGKQGREAGSEQRDDRYRIWMRKVARITARTHARLPAVAGLPLVVVGIDRYLGFLAEVSSDLRIAAVVHGSPDAFTDADLDQRLGAETHRLRDDVAVAALARVAHAIGSGRTSVDSSETLRWAELGRIDTLIVEEQHDSPNLREIAVRVYSRGGSVVSAPTGAVARGVPALSPATWVALLRW